MVEQLLRAEEVSACYAWFVRVPSPSNPADGPSRNDCADLCQSGASLIDVDDIVESCIQNLAESDLG